MLAALQIVLFSFLQVNSINKELTTLEILIGIIWGTTIFFVIFVLDKIFEVYDTSKNRLYIKSVSSRINNDYIVSTKGDNEIIIKDKKNEVLIASCCDYQVDLDLCVNELEELIEYKEKYHLKPIYEIIQATRSGEINEKVFSSYCKYKEHENYELNNLGEDYLNSENFIIKYEDVYNELKSMSITCISTRIIDFDEIDNNKLKSLSLQEIVNAKYERSLSAHKGRQGLIECVCNIVHSRLI